MDINACFPSKYVSHADLRGQDVAVTIATVAMENVDRDDSGNGQSTPAKPVLYFQGMSKALVLNKTNARAVTDWYGPETDNWVGRPVTLYPAETEYAGRPCDCIRIRRKPDAATLRPVPQSTPAPQPIVQPAQPQPPAVAPALQPVGGAGSQVVF